MEKLYLHKAFSLIREVSASVKPQDTYRLCDFTGAKRNDTEALTEKLRGQNKYPSEYRGSEEVP